MSDYRDQLPPLDAARVYAQILGIPLPDDPQANSAPANAHIGPTGSKDEPLTRLVSQQGELIRELQKHVREQAQVMLEQQALIQRQQATLDHAAEYEPLPVVLSEVAPLSPDEALQRGAAIADQIAQFFAGCRQQEQERAQDGPEGAN